ncbi:MAG: hypothetical protein D6714_10985, partial [Bacteroidetes bacterium]
MSDYPSNELDKLFREGSEKYDFQYNPKAWEQMETLLDKADRRRRLLIWWLSGVGLFILIFSCWFVFQKGTPESPAHHPVPSHVAPKNPPVVVQKHKEHPHPDSNPMDHRKPSALQPPFASPTPAPKNTFASPELSNTRPTDLQKTDMPDQIPPPPREEVSIIPPNTDTALATNLRLPALTIFVLRQNKTMAYLSGLLT